MTKYIIRYNVRLPLGNGGGKVGQFKTLGDAKAFVGRQDLRIWKTWYERTNNGKYHIVHEEFKEIRA